MNSKPFPIMMAVVSIALLALAIYTRMALDWPITLWLLLGALVGTWYTSAKSWVADMKQNKMDLSDGKRFFTIMTIIPIICFVIYLIIHLGFAESYNERKAKEHAIQQYAIEYAKSVIEADNYGLALQNDLKNAQIAYKGDSSLAQMLADMSEAVLRMHSEKAEKMKSLFSLYDNLGLDFIQDSITQTSKLYAEKWTAMYNIILNTNVWAKVRSEAFLDSINRFANKYDECQKKAKASLNGVLNMVKIDGDSLYRSLGYPKKVNTMPIEALPIFAKVSRACPAFVRFRDSFDYKEMSDSDGIYYDGKARYGLKSLRVIIKEDLNYDVRTINNVCNYVLTKKEDRVLTIKEACGILCKGTYHSLDGKEEYRFDEKIPKDAITVNR